MGIEIADTHVLSSAYHVLRRVAFSWPTRAGGRRSATHEVLERRDASAILLHNRARGTLVLVRQYRLAAAMNGHAAPMLEVAAGLIDAGETPLDTALREAGEETGYAAADALGVCSIYPSPGVVTERIHLFHAEIGDADRTGAGGGLEHENEDIEVVELPCAEVREMVDSGAIQDAKTLVLLQWFFARNPG